MIEKGKAAHVVILFSTALLVLRVATRAKAFLHKKDVVSQLLSYNDTLVILYLVIIFRPNLRVLLLVKCIRHEFQSSLSLGTYY